ncbi:MAG: hypothetical protein JNK04_07100 [Myxococcales bacterium]|nr:hypothetical protein [Myxococcales bacterium]
MLEKAARVTSPVAHASSMATNLSTPAGVVAGIVGLILAPEVTVPAAIVGFLGTMGTANLAGHLIDKYAMGEDASEKIKTGVEHVFIDEPKYQAANAGPKTLTDEHNEEVQTGALHAYIENRPFSRRTDMTKCEGMIVNGSDHVFVGGEPTSASRTPGQVVDGLTSNVEFVLDVFAVTQLPKSSVEGISYLKGLAEKVGGVDFGPAGDAFDVITTIFQ